MLDQTRPGDSTRGIVSNDSADNPFDSVTLIAALGIGFLPGPGSGLTAELSLSAFGFGTALDAITSERLPANLSNIPNPAAGIIFIDPETSNRVSYFATVNALTQRVTVPASDTLLLFAIGMLIMMIGNRECRRMGWLKPQ